MILIAICGSQTSQSSWVTCQQLQSIHRPNVVTRQFTSDFISAFHQYCILAVIQFGYSLLVTFQSYEPMINIMVPSNQLVCHRLFSTPQYVIEGHMDRQTLLSQQYQNLQQMLAGPVLMSSLGSYSSVVIVKPPPIYTEVNITHTEQSARGSQAQRYT